MKPYRSKSGKKSGVIGYENGYNYIIVEFDHFIAYKYTYKSAGRLAVEEMKDLATAQEGLSSFISRYDPKYESQFKTARSR